MKRCAAIAALVAASALAGCAGAHLGLQSGNPAAARAVPVAGTSYSSASVHAETSASSHVGALILGVIMLGAERDSPDASRGPNPRRVPEMAEGRGVEERDCTRPLGQLAGNLRCR